MSKRLALLIGVPEYDKEAIPNLPVVHNDIRDLASVLERSKYTVRALGTGGANPATRNNTRGAIEDALSEAGTGDTLLVYFSGHGAHYKGKDWLVPSDGRITGPEFHDYLVHLDFASFVENSRAGTVLFFIDACREGVELGEGGDKSLLSIQSWGEEKRDHVKNRLFALVFGCRQGDVCRFVENADSFSLFTRALTTALDPTTQHKKLGQILDAVDAELKKLCEEHYPGQPAQRVRFLRETDVASDDEIRSCVICDGTVLGRRPGDRAGFREPSDAKALLDYSAEIVKQHGYIRFLGLPHLRDNPDVPIDRLYVEPSISESHIQPDRPTEDWPDTTPALETVAASQRLVLLGDPGSGKSTLVSWIAWQLSQPGDNAWTKRLGRLVPIPMILRDMEIGPDITWDGLLEAFLALPVAKPLNENGKGRERLTDLLERGQALIMLDGLDEIGSATVRKALQTAVFDGYVLHLSCRWILTSRIVGYGAGSFNPVAFGGPHGSLGVVVKGRAPDAEIADLRYVAPFSDEQIKRFAYNWYLQHERAEHERQQRARELVAAIASNEGTHHLARIPNLLTLIALIYRVYRWLPHGRAMLYDRIAEAYLESIDRFRGLDSLDEPLAEKKRWLAYVGFQMQLRRDEGEDQSKREILADEKQVHKWIAEAMGDTVSDADAAARRFVDYIARRSGLLLPRGEGQFAFMHLSFQEYFASCYCLEQVTAARWLDGRAKKQSFSPDELRGYAYKRHWRETLILLFEALADRPGWPDDLVECLYGEELSELSSDSAYKKRNAALLLAEISIDPHSGLSPDRRRAGLAACWRWELAPQQEAGYDIEFTLPVGIGSFLLSATGQGSEAVWSAFCVAARGLCESTGPSVLDFFDCRLTDARLKHVAALTGLQTLDLRSTPITDAGLKYLAAVTGLQSLFLGACGQITDAGLEHIAALTGLQSLDLGSTPITDAGLSHLAGLTGLQSLALRSTTITDVGLAHLAALTGLQSLDLSHTQITDAGLKHLAGCASLTDEKLNTFSTKVTEAGRKRLFQAIERRKRTSR